MKNPFRPISISLSPNMQADDVRLAFLLWCGIKKARGGAVLEFEQEFKNYLGVKGAYSFNSGRSSLMAILRALELGKGAQVLLQAFTCNAAVNPIRWAGLEPVFVDCDQNYNLSVGDLEKKITPRARAVMVQHTFGQPADIDEIVEVCRKHNLVLIEDCAHALGAEYKGKKIGTFGEAAFFSFGRDKMISCVYGGMVAANDEQLAKKINNYQQKIGDPMPAWTRQQLLHPVLMAGVILPTYSVLGKYLLVTLQWSRILSKAIHWKEKRGLRPDYFPRRMPEALAKLALKQFKKLEKFNAHRAIIADFYYNELKDSDFYLPNTTPDKKAVYLRFAVRHEKAEKIIKKAWSKNLLLGDWYRTPVDPFDTRPEAIGYKKDSCPNAEKFAGKMVNLPTHINIETAEATAIVKFLKEWK